MPVSEHRTIPDLNLMSLSLSLSLAGWMRQLRLTARLVRPGKQANRRSPDAAVYSVARRMFTDIVTDITTTVYSCNRSIMDGLYAYHNVRGGNMSIVGILANGVFADTGGNIVGSQGPGSTLTHHFGPSSIWGHPALQSFSTQGGNVCSR